LSHKEIAEYLGISENTSKTQYFKAKKFIQKILESEKIAG
jgi:DNA-directed RNA polymerase specialized sigma24 family protein